MSLIDKTGVGIEASHDAAIEKIGYPDWSRAANQHDIIGQELRVYDYVFITGAGGSGSVIRRFGWIKKFTSAKVTVRTFDRWGLGKKISDTSVESSSLLKIPDEMIKQYLNQQK